MESDLVIFGEVLYDCFEDGSKALGGAPFNVAWGLKGLGHDPLFLSSIGTDEAGKQVQETIQSWGMTLDGIGVVPEYPTGDVRIWLEDGDAKYEIHHPRAWDRIEDKGHSCTGYLYHGLLALRDPVNRNTLTSIIERSPGAKRFFDINLRPPYDSLELVRKWAQGCDWLKLNIEELAFLLDLKTIQLGEARDYVSQIRDRMDVANVLLTAGSEGALISGEIGDAICSPAPTPETFTDTVGAGDSFSAYTLHGLLEGDSAQQIVEGASLLASRICGLNGATSTDREFYH